MFKSPNKNALIKKKNITSVGFNSLFISSLKLGTLNQFRYYINIYRNQLTKKQLILVFIIIFFFVILTVQLSSLFLFNSESKKF